MDAVLGDRVFIYSRGPLRIEVRPLASGAFLALIGFGIMRHEVEIPKRDAERLRAFLADALGR